MDSLARSKRPALHRQHADGFLDIIPREKKGSQSIANFYFWRQFKVIPELIKTLL